jgi:hypothetical protein
MSSTDSSSTEAHVAGPGPDASQGRPPQHGRPGRRPALTAAAALALLAVLVWGLNPRQPELRPAPLKPPQSACAPTASDFTPSNLTDIPDKTVADLPDAVSNRVLLRLNMEPCSCGCKQSLAMCRAANPRCPVSPQALEAIVKEEGADAAKPSSHAR